MMQGFVRKLKQAKAVRTQTDASGATVLMGAGGPIDTINRSNTPVVLYEGDSITARYGDTPEFSATATGNTYCGHHGNCYATWERAELGNVYSFVNQAVSGETIEQITARLLATDLSGYAAVSLMCGTNNISAAADVAGDIALIESVCQYCLDNSKPMRLSTIITLATASLTADKKAYILAYNTAIKKLPQEYPNVFVGDAFLGVQDTTSADPAPIANALFADGTHPTKYGSFRMSKYGTKAAMEDALRYAGYGRIIDANTMRDDGSAYTELLTNTTFATQTGGTDSTVGVLTVGGVPDGWRLRLAATPTNVKSYFPFYVAEATRQRGIWVTAYVYEVGDTVTDTGGAYVCTTAHTAGATFAGDAANWKRVWSTEYCWQIEFTADAASDGIIVQRESALSAIAGDTVVQGTCGLAVEGEVSKVLGDTQGHFRIDCSTVASNYSLMNCSLYPANSGTEATVGERFEGVFETKRLAFQSALPADLKDQHFKIVANLNAAGTASIIIYKPSLRSYP